VTAEWVLLTREHVDAVAVLAGAADVDPDIGVRQLWNGGALQLVDASGVVLLTLLQSRRLDVDVDARRLLGAEGRGAWEATEPPLWWTEIHTAAQPPFRGTATRVVRAIATAAGGTAAPRSGPDAGPGDAGGERR
jgi:hypothetical protein